MNGSTLRFLSADDATQIAWRSYPCAAADAGADVPTVVLTNGLSTTDNFWGPLVQALAPHGRVVHWSYRGHGESEGARSSDYSIRAHARDLARVAEAAQALGRDGRPPVHVAFSMGVTVLLELYRARPDLVGAMVLVAGGADRPRASDAALGAPGVQRALRSAMRLASPWVPRGSKVARRVTAAPFLFPAARALGIVGEGAPRAELEQFFRAVGAMDLRAYWESMRSLLEASASDVLPTVRVPALVIAPERDLLASRADLEALRDGIAGAEWMAIPGTTHAVLLEAGAPIADRVRDFVERAHRGR